MALTEDQKAELLTHFSSRGLVEAFDALVEGQRAPLMAKLKATPKAEFNNEAMSLMDAKSGLRTLDALMEELLRVQKETATE